MLDYSLLHNNVYEHLTDKLYYKLLIINNILKIHYKSLVLAIKIYKIYILILIYLIKY